MLKQRARGTIVAAAFASAAVVLPLVSGAQGSASQTYETSVASGPNFDKAEFRLWLPNTSGPVDAVLVLVPGSNGDGRAMATDTVWQSFATKHKLAIVACRFTDRPHDQGFIEEYVAVARGSGQALLDALLAFGRDAKHPELAQAPLLLWGMSAGGEFNYEFVAWKPERVIAFVVNKGGIYYTALAPRGARDVPGMLFVGEKDLAFRTNTITGLFAVNRRAGALWALAEEPGAAHVVGRSRDMGIIFFEDVLALRLGAPEFPGGPRMLKTLTLQSGFLGDFLARTFTALGEGAAPNYPTAWLPTERVARAWQAVVTEKPFEP